METDIDEESDGNITPTSNRSTKSYVTNLDDVNVSRTVSFLYLNVILDVLFVL